MISEFDNEGFGEMEEEDLQDRPRSMLEPQEMYRIMCQLAARIAPWRGKSLQPGYNLMILEDLEGRLAHLHRHSEDGLTDIMKFPIGSIPESGDAGERMAKCVDDWANPNGPFAVYERKDEVLDTHNNPLVTYYVEVSRG